MNNESQEHRQDFPFSIFSFTTRSPAENSSVQSLINRILRGLWPASRVHTGSCTYCSGTWNQTQERPKASKPRALLHMPKGKRKNKGLIAQFLRGAHTYLPTYLPNG